MPALEKDTKLVMTILFVGAISGTNVYFYAKYGDLISFNEYAHALIFWGFLMLVTDVIDLGTGGLFAELLGMLFLENIWNLIVDIGYLMAGIGILAALYRRLILRPEKLKNTSMEGVLILFAILGIVITAFIVEAGYMLGEENHYNSWEPIGVVFAKQMQDIDSNTLQTIIDLSYWIHMI